MKILKLAYRNIWRNKRRTLITAASILFAVFFATVMKSIQTGAWGHMVDQVVHYYFGYGQIHKEGFWKDRSLDQAFEVDEKWDKFINPSEGVLDLVPRIESFALASKGEKSKGTIVVGVDPEKENALTQLSERIIKGNYFANGKSVLVSEGLAEYLKINVLDTIVLISQGYHGVNAAGKYAIDGIVAFGSPELNGQMVFMPLDQAQVFYGAEGLITTYVVQTDDPDNITATVSNLRTELGDEYEVMDYKELMPELMEAKSLDTAGGSIIISILYCIIAFGIFGTILMMIKERSYEFGILKSIGMASSKINLMVWLETMFLGLIGCIAGMLVALPVVGYLTVNPIRFTGEMAAAYEKFGVEAVLPAAIVPEVFLNQAIVVFIMITLMALYPMWKISKLKPIEAMRN